MVAEPWQVTKARELDLFEAVSFENLRYSVHYYRCGYVVLPHEPKRLEDQKYQHLGWIFTKCSELEAFMLGKECEYTSLTTRDI